MIFKSTIFQLTGWYVLIVMIISMLFSSLVYRISANEIGTFNRKQSMTMRQSFEFGPSFSNIRIKDIEELRERQLVELRHNLIKNLMLTNLIILLLAGIASYYLAKRTLKPIEDMVDLQNRFTADASHELRTPLAAMKLENEVALRDKKLNLTIAKDLLKSNLEEIDKLEELSNNLLKLAQYQQEQEFSKYKEFSVKEVINQAVKRIEPISKNKQIAIETKNVKDIRIEGDEKNIIDLLVIILDNAIKYSSSKTTVVIESFSNKKYALVKIKDQGIGIKGSDLPHIFNRFYRADQSRSKENYSGHGLGLSIAKRIVDSHSGFIDAQSTIGEGSVFIVKLPLKQNVYLNKLKENIKNN